MSFLWPTPVPGSIWMDRRKELGDFRYEVRAVRGRVVEYALVSDSVVKQSSMLLSVRRFHSTYTPAK